MNPVQAWNAGYNSAYGPGYDPYLSGNYGGYDPYYNGGIFNQGYDRRFPMERMNAHFYERNHKVDTAKKGGLLGAVLGGIGGFAAGAKIGGSLGSAGGPLGLAAGVIGGGVLGWLVGDKLGGFDATQRDARDNGVLDGSPNYFDPYGYNGYF